MRLEWTTISFYFFKIFNIVVFWRWRRRLWVWEEDMLGECVTLLRSVSLQFNVTNY